MKGDRLITILRAIIDVKDLTFVRYFSKIPPMIVSPVASERQSPRDRTREEVFDLIRASRGLTRSALAKATGLATSTVCCGSKAGLVSRLSVAGPLVFTCQFE